MVSAPAPDTAQSRLKGIVSMLIAVGAFAAMDTLLKLLSQHYPPMQVSAMRGYASLPFILLPLVFTGKFAELKPVHWKLHLLRGVLAVFMLTGFVYAISVLSLADAYAIYLSAPLIVTALSGPVLGEKVGWHRWAAVVVGLCGVMVMLRPSGSSVATYGALAAFICAISYAISAVGVRILTRTDSNTSVVFWSMAIMTLVNSIIAIPRWVPIRFEHVGMIVACGFVGAIAAIMLTRAFRSAPVSVVAPFEYTALLWGVAIDWLVWGTLPGARMYVGGGIVIGSGLYIIWRESREHMAPPAASTGAA